MGGDIGLHEVLGVLMTARLQKAIVALWASAAALGLFLLHAYAATVTVLPAPLAAAEWPAATSLPRRAGIPTLVAFIHPSCPCSRASLHELERLFSRVPGERSVVVVLTGGEQDSAESGAAWQLAERIPDVTRRLDPKGDEAARFGATTSGEVFLYGRNGALEFEGGVTAARGHEGPSAGGIAVEAALNGQPHLRSTPVFGCSLQ